MDDDKGLYFCAPFTANQRDIEVIQLNYLGTIEIAHGVRIGISEVILLFFFLFMVMIMATGLAVTAVKAAWNLKVR